MSSTKFGDAAVTGAFGDARVAFPLRAGACDVRRRLREAQLAARRADDVRHLLLEQRT